MATPQSPEAPFRSALDAVIADLGINVDSLALDKMTEHYRLLRLWNKRLNLTRITEPEEAATRHFGEALFLGREIGLESGSLADLGSGAGFPGLPLAAWRPSVEVTLIESSSKKATFLREVSRTWGNVRVCAQRVEHASGRFDMATMRAVAAGPILEDLLRLAGRFALLVSAADADELRSDGRFLWERPGPLPWGHGVLLLGRPL